MFITNEPNGTTLENEILQKIKYCSEIKILVGYFYFSGIQSILEEIKNKKDLQVKILIGLDVDEINNNTIELQKKHLNRSSSKEHYFESIKKTFVYEDFDNEEFYKNVMIYCDLMEQGCIEIRKTTEPNHAKVYIFKMDEQNTDLLNGFFITGSSNLTKHGLKDQTEFNVSIKDYGIEEANSYFDKLWKDAIPFEKDDVNKIIYLMKNETILKEITPFEAYLYILKTYLDSFEKKEISDSLKEKFEKAGYKPYKYQLDAIGQAISIIENHNGVIIADVVGLGKSIIGSAIAFELKKRGLVIAPPGLIGSDDKSTGWKKYLEDFGLAAMGWEAHSLGSLEKVFELTKNINDFEVIIVDEAHRFRNENTLSYTLLREICRNKKVILLTATPFNNRPSDIFSLLKLFTIPKQSTISFDPNIEAKFTRYQNLFNDLLFIKKNCNTENKKTQERVIKTYKNLFKLKINNFSELNINRVNSKLKEVSLEIKSILSPVMIRRNRLDLMKHPEYKKDLGKLSIVDDPKKGFYELTKKQSEFYDKVIQKYFVVDGEFKGAIYMPINYAKDTTEFDKQFQKNLYDLMRRLLVKRFESSFGAFYQTIQNFIKIHNNVLEFINKTQLYILEREWIEKINELEEEEFWEEYNKKMNEITTTKDDFKKGNLVYKLSDLDDQFIEDINQDIKLFESIKNEIQELKLVTKDPKADAIAEKIIGAINKDPKRKIIIFSEFQNTIEHFYDYFKNYNESKIKILKVSSNISKKTYNDILQNFDASLPKKQQTDEYNVLLCTDKLSEGFNLNRAGFVINYDIPWNPVRVIQRLGRINRIGKKVFDELYIMNFFPTEKGEDVINQQKIAESKMFFIHNAIGEDAKIFSADEEPRESELFTRLNKNPENLEEESTYTKVFVEFEKYKQQYPDIIKRIQQLPPRIKISKLSDANEIITTIKKKNIYFVYFNSDDADKMPEPRVLNFEDIWEKIKAEPNTKNLAFSSAFWALYQKTLAYQPNEIIHISENSNLSKAINILAELKIKMNTNTFYLSNEITDFIELLNIDIDKFGTLSEYIISEIAKLKLNENVEESIKQIKDRLGPDYNFKNLEKHNNQNKYIIIAIENQSQNLYN